MAASMKYGGYAFDPVPLMSLDKIFNRTEDHTSIGTDISVVLEGTLVAVSNNQGGIDDIDVKMDAMRQAFASDGLAFKIWCDDESDPWFSGRPYISNVRFDQSNNNWVFTTPYTIELQFHETLLSENSLTWGGHNIQSVNETISFEPIAENSPFTWVLDTPSNNSDGLAQQYRVEHSMNVVGKKTYATGGEYETDGYINARNFIHDYMGFSVTGVATGLYNISFESLTGLNHARSVTCDVYNGSCVLNESWIYISTDGDAVYHGDAIEDFNIGVTKGTSDDLMRVTIEGQIQGLEYRRDDDVVGNYELVRNKYTNASGYWVTVKPFIYPRVKYIASGEGRENRPINILPVNETVSHNPSKGLITYNYEFNDRPATCYTGALQESIVVTDTKPVDVFASLIVLGRANGPILQDIGTQTSYTRTLSIDAVVKPTQACMTDTDAIDRWLNDRPNTVYDQFVTAMNDRLEADYTPGQVFKSNDSEMWDGSNGRYNRSVTWTYSTC